MKRKDNSQVEIAYEYLKKRIISYHLSPETQLSDFQIATELEMSRTSVREAILLLEMDGLVQINEKGKIVVAPIGIDDVMDILNVRCALETEAVRQIVQHGWLTSVQEKELQYIQNKMSRCTTIDMTDEHYDYDDLFHAKLVEASNSKRILEILERMRIQMQRARWLNIIHPKRLLEASSEHEAILEALLTHDSEAILPLIRKHFENSMKAFSEIFEDQKMHSIASMISNFCHSKGDTT